MAEILHVNKDNFEEVVLKSKTPVLVDFFATWCGPCKMLGPVLEQVADETNNVKIYKVDIDESMEIAEKYGLISVPTLIMFNNGEEVAREIGFRQKKQILDLIEDKTNN